HKTPPKKPKAKGVAPIKDKTKVPKPKVVIRRYVWVGKVLMIFNPKINNSHIPIKKVCPIIFGANVPKGEGYFR
ncbi:MAG: hypothetical protein IKL33_03105, partial [Alphaproteobacteria bacterium]|nr:hypothetical protein [Alphaproteobacteria bacterium]